MRYAKLLQDDTYGLWLIFVTGSHEPRAALKSQEAALAWCDLRAIPVSRAAYSAWARSN